MKEFTKKECKVILTKALEQIKREVEQMSKDFKKRNNVNKYKKTKAGR